MTVDDAGGDPIAPGALRSEPLPTARDANDGRMRNLLEWGVIIVIAVAFAFLVRGFAFQTFYIPSESMVPRLETDDRVLVNKITYENAMRWYSFDPFQHRSKEQSTVGALRAEAAGHDVSIRSFDKGRFEHSHKGIDLGDMAAKATA